MSRYSPPAKGTPPANERRRPLGAHELQDAALAGIVRELGHDPEKLPPHLEPGLPGLRAKAGDRALQQPAIFTTATFRKAWQRLRDRQPGAEEDKNRGT